MSALLTMPRLGETMERGTVRAWLVAPGQPFKRGDVIAEIETDKTTVELPALADGTIEEIFAKEGDVVDVDAPIARLAGDGVQEKAKPAMSLSEPAKKPLADSSVRLPDSARIAASPAARRAASARGLSLADVPGTGPGGRRQGWDVQAFAERRTSPGSPKDGLLHIAERGEGTGLPVVFLHGFGGSLDNWTNVQNTIALHRRTIAIDLPGHGKSVAHGAADWSAMATALAATLVDRSVGRAHFVGHSMGGAVAATLALAEPQRVASLVLIAPAGIGPEVNRDLLARFAEAKTEAEVAPLIQQFFGPSARRPRALPALIAEMRGDPAHRAALLRILAATIPDGVQQTIDLGALAATGIPVRVLWGTEDHVMPISEADALPAVFALHRFKGVGHMPHLEAPRDTIRIVKESARGE